MISLKKKKKNLLEIVASRVVQQSFFVNSYPLLLNKAEGTELAQKLGDLYLAM